MQYTVNHFFFIFFFKFSLGVFLIDTWNAGASHLDEWRADLMRGGFGDAADEEVNRSIVFGYQTALLLKEFVEQDKHVWKIENRA